MARFARGLIVICTFATAFSQTVPQNGSTHGPVLTLVRENEPSDSPAVKTCLANHPPLACMLLTVTLRNEGKEDFLSEGSTCYPDSFIFIFDLKEPDGGWKQFPARGDHWVCEATVAFARLAFHGKSYTWHFRLAESAHDTAFLARAPRARGGSGPSVDVPFTGPVAIHARYGVGCVAAVYMGEEERVFPLSDYACVGDPAEKIEVQSNELELTAGPAAH